MRDTSAREDDPRYCVTRCAAVQGAICNRAVSADEIKSLDHRGLAGATLAA
jgi:hypothetical protein